MLAWILKRPKRCKISCLVSLHFYASSQRPQRRKRSASHQHSKASKSSTSMYPYTLYTVQLSMLEDILRPLLSFSSRGCFLENTIDELISLLVMKQKKVEQLPITKLLLPSTRQTSKKTKKIMCPSCERKFSIGLRMPVRLDSISRNL